MYSIGLHGFFYFKASDYLTFSLKIKRSISFEIKMKIITFESKSQAYENYIYFVFDFFVF